MKLEPLTVKSKGAAPTIALSGEMEVICGAGLLMRNWSAFETLELAFWALTEANPADATSEGEIVAVTSWLLTKVAGTDWPFQRTIVEEAKFDPLTARVKPFPPTITLPGDNETNAAAELGRGGELASLPPPHPIKATARDVSTTVASIVSCLNRCMARSSAIFSIVVQVLRR